MVEQSSRLPEDLDLTPSIAQANNNNKKKNPHKTQKFAFQLNMIIKYLKA